MTKTNITNVLKKFFNHIYLSYIPNKRDNLKQIIIKSLFIICLITLIVSAVYLANYFWEAEHQDSIIDYSREIWHETEENITPTDKDEAVIPEETEKAQFMLD